MDRNTPALKTEQLGHLGLVVATIKELGLIDKIDFFPNLS
jgi:hypothetical protein